jgi:tetratricopeptide (TPR) repeat protein
MERSRRIQALLLAILVGTATTALTAAVQEKPSPTSEYQYRKDYAQVDGIIKEADLDKRAEALFGFVKEHPQSRMIPYVWGYLQQIMAEKEKAGAADKVLALHEQWLALRPDDTGAQKSLMAANYRAKKFDKAAELAEKLYAASKDKALLGDLLALYQQLQNAEKWAATANLILQEYPIEQSYGTALQLAKIHAHKSDLPKACEYANKVLAAFGDKVPPGLQEPAWNATRIELFGYLGANEYAKKDYAKATESFEKIVQIDKQNDAAHYQIAMCKWRSQDLDNAMAAFARAAVLNKTTSKKAQEYLEQIYKPRHNNTLDGMDQLLAKAKSEVGVS